MSFWNWSTPNITQDSINQINTKLDQILALLKKPEEIPYTPCQTPAPRTINTNTEFQKELADKLAVLRGNMGESHGF